MLTHADKKQENNSQSVANAVSQKKSGTESTFQFVDNRPEAIAQRRLQEMANNSQRAMQLKAFHEITSNSPHARQAGQLRMNPSDHVVQRAWIRSEGGTLHWDPYIDGVEWIMLESGDFYYEVRNPAMQEQYGGKAGIEFAQSRENWVQERVGRVPEHEVDPYVNDPSVVVPGAQELRRDNGLAMEELATTMNQWKGSTENGQYRSLIDGILEYAVQVEDQDALVGWKAKIHLGAVFHDGQIYIAFKYVVENDHIVLDKIVKNPNSQNVATREQNEGLNRSAHSFLSSQSRTELDADNEGLVNTYYKYGYRLKSNYFEIDKPEAINQIHWDNRQPNEEERGALRHALTQTGHPPGLMWRMVREM